jgi:hypothetical protein
MSLQTLEIAEVLDQQQLSGAGQDAGGFHKELRTPGGLADFVRGEEEKQSIAGAIG